jgi:phospholipase C
MNIRFRWLVPLVLTLAATLAFACTNSTVNPSVTICTPGNNSSAASPVHIVAQTNSTSAVTKMDIWVDGVKVFILRAPTIDTYIPMTAATHKVVVHGYNSAGQTFGSTISVTASVPSVTQFIDPTKIKHIIFMLQENRSLDNYLGRFGAYRSARGLPANWDALPLNVQLLDNGGHLIKPYHLQTVCTDNTTPAWNESHAYFDYLNMDRFLITNAKSMPTSNDPYGQRAIGYYNSSDLPYYYALAFNFGTSDKFFSSVLAPTIPNRMYMFAATSFGHIRPDSPPSGGWTQPNIFEALDKAGVSWRYYYQDNSVFLAQWSDWFTGDNQKVYGISHYFTDIQDPNTLPSVIFIERAGVTGLDEHPMNNIQKGAADVANLITKLMQSPSWDTSVFILSYDEAGGLYEHVPPQSIVKPDNIAPMLLSGDAPGDFAHTGYRVPLIVVSPWSKPNFVSHVQRDLTSILKMIEVRFNLPALTARDAAADDMAEFFDFSTPHWLTPPALPTQPTTGTCDKTKERAPGF